jgi:hypothetical protein
MTAPCSKLAFSGADLSPLSCELAQLLDSAERIRVGIGTLRRRSLANEVTEQTNAEWLAAYDAAGGSE